MLQWLRKDILKRISKFGDAQEIILSNGYEWDDEYGFYRRSE
jgi:hypothetical protein